MNGWEDSEIISKGRDLEARGKVDQTLGTLTAWVYRGIGAYDAGFEAGVLAAEAGVGRADE